MKRFKGQQTYLLLLLILSIFSITGCGLLSDKVTFTVPANGATGFAINEKIAATFSKEMDPATITAATFTLKQGATAVPGTIDYAGVTAVFTPDDDLAASTIYTATITTGVKQLDGDKPLSDYVWSFTTGTTADDTQPTVTLLSPADGSTDVCINKTLSITFSEEMNPLTITDQSFSVIHDITVSVTGTVTYDSKTNIATFKPSSDLIASTKYIVVIGPEVKDLAGNALASNLLWNYVWSFTTGTTTCTETQ